MGKYGFILLPLLRAVKPAIKQKMDAEMNDGDDNDAIELQILYALIEVAELILSGKE